MRNFIHLKDGYVPLKYYYVEFAIISINPIILYGIYNKIQNIDNVFGLKTVKCPNNKYVQRVGH